MTAETTNGEILAFVHLGDLHTTEPEESGHADFLAIASQIGTQVAKGIDFVALPGDCANNGLPKQYALIAPVLRMLGAPVRIVPGDHDMEQGSLDNFYGGLGAERLPAAISVRGHRCLFLDFCSQGEGGLDFRLGTGQLDWLEAELAAAKGAGETALVFMHSYPKDLTDTAEGQELTRLLTDYKVAFADIGHTHYNELSNDGTTVTAATRSIGQREEGGPGYSIVTLDGGVVGWRFKALGDPFPFVAITSPADHRLRRPLAHDPAPAFVGARVFGWEPIDRVEFQLEGGDWIPMERQPNGIDWRAPLPPLTAPLTDLTVRAFAAPGAFGSKRRGAHTIRVARQDHRAPWCPPAGGDGIGSDASSIGAWPENGILGTQLGPNRNGRDWPPTQPGEPWKS